MLGRGIWDKFPRCIFKDLSIEEKHEDNFKTFKNHEGHSSPKLSEPNKWLLVNHAEPTNTSVLKAHEILNSEQLQISGQ